MIPRINFQILRIESPSSRGDRGTKYKSEWNAEMSGELKIKYYSIAKTAESGEKLFCCFLFAAAKKYYAIAFVSVVCSLFLSETDLKMALACFSLVLYSEVTAFYTLLLHDGTPWYFWAANSLSCIHKASNEQLRANLRFAIILNLKYDGTVPKHYDYIISLIYNINYFTNAKPKLNCLPVLESWNQFYIRVSQYYYLRATILTTHETDPQKDIMV